MIKLLKFPIAFALFTLLVTPLYHGNKAADFFSAETASALSSKVNPVGTNLIVDIAKNKNPGVVFVTSKKKIKTAKGKYSLFIANRCKNSIKSLERQIYKEGTVIPDKDSGYDHFNDALGYMIEYLYPIRRDFNPTRPKRWS